MSRRTKAWLLALFVASELLIAWSNWEEVRAVQRTIYQTAWRYLPKPEGYTPPDRFAPHQK